MAYMAGARNRFSTGRVHIFGEDFVRKYSLGVSRFALGELLAGWQIRYFTPQQEPRRERQPGHDTTAAIRCDGRLCMKTMFCGVVWRKNSRQLRQTLA